MKYCLWRILGNDIPLRHGLNRTEKNLKMVLDYEPDFPDCKKIFLLNRIHDQQKSDRYKEMIHKAGHEFHQMAFIPSRYENGWSDSYKEKVDYVTNVNPARNYCIKWGLDYAEYVLPLDSGSIFRQDGWDQLNTMIRSNTSPYYLLGQSRLAEQEMYHDPDVVPCLKEEYRYDFKRRIGLREPGIVFGKEATCRFNETYLYGQRDKIELLWRLGVRGVWDDWATAADIEQLTTNTDTYGEGVGIASWVFILPSGNAEADENNQLRSTRRTEGLESLIKEIDRKYL